MTLSARRPLWILAMLFALSFTLTAQTAVNSIPPPSARMFVGENIKYTGKVNKILRGLTVAELTFTASAGSGPDELLIKSEAVSKGTLLKLIRYSFLQRYESLVDIPRFRILRTTKHDVQKERVRDSEALFNYTEKMVSFVETDPKDPMRPPRRIASDIGAETYDMISAVYAVRLLPLAIGKKFEFSVSDSGLVYKVPFTVTARELKKTELGRIWCWRVEPDIFGPGRLIEQKGSLVVWLTDDDRRIPVRAEVETNLGKVDIRLKTYTKAGGPATPRRA